MAEGRTKKFYQSDLITVYDNAGAGQPAEFQFEVPNNLAAQAELGWRAAPTTIPTTLKRPRGFTPRHIIGIGSNGKRYRAIVADITADCWTAVDPTWTIIDNFGSTVTVTRTGRVGEKATG
jgi:hypothetical protein